MSRSESGRATQLPIFPWLCANPKAESDSSLRTEPDFDLAPIDEDSKGVAVMDSNDLAVVSALTAEAATRQKMRYARRDAFTGYTKCDGLHPG